MPLPKKLEIADDQVKGRDVKEALNALIEYLTPAPTVPLETMERAEWSNTPPVVDGIAVGTVRPLDGTNLVDVFDGSSWLRMKQDYYEEKYGPMEEVSEPE